MMLTFDKALADSLTGRVLPRPTGVTAPGTEQKKFWDRCKTSAHFFLEDTCHGKQLVQWDLWCGDLWIRENQWVAEEYLNLYGEYLSKWGLYLVAMLCGLSTSYDTMFFWDHHSFEEYAEEMKDQRTWREEHGYRW